MAEFNTILALDSAMGGCSAAVIAGERSAVESRSMTRGQAEHLVPFANTALAQVSVEYATLDALICTVGPGAFTGLRIGMSAAKAFELSLDIPLFGITTTQALALAFAVEHGGACTAIVETKRSDFYVQSFDAQGVAVDAVKAVEGADVNVRGVLIGDAVTRFCEESGYDGAVDATGYVLPNMVLVAQALRERGCESRVFISDVQPVYLRGADVSQPKNPPRVLAK